MYALSNIMCDRSRFLLGVELVTTRGTMSEVQAVHARSFSTELVHSPNVDWVSITDNAGGNPQLSPMALGKPILYGGKEVLIHLSCKDFNRNGLESEAWQLASEGFHNILALSGDYPATGYHGKAKPVFDIDSVGLLTMLDEMNRGLCRPQVKPSGLNHRMKATNFFVGAVATNFKRYENEVVPQMLKLRKKIECGARFIIAQIGFDCRKSHEMQCYLANCGLAHIPLLGNVFLLAPGTVEFFRKQSIPGAVISESLYQLCQKHARSTDRGAMFFRELAAKQLAVFRGLKFAGGYLGGVHAMEDVQAILDIERTFSPDDWKLFAREVQFPLNDEYYEFQQDEATGLADVSAPALARQRPTSRRNVTFGYRLSKLVHNLLFVPDRGLHKWFRKLYASAANTEQGPALLRIMEHAGKAAMFRCRDCGDCSLPEIAFLCPESHCVKNQRNGPCGGTRDGKCEVEDFECIWSRAYDRLKYEGREQQLLDHAPVIQDQSLRGTSSWANALLGRDHTAQCELLAAPKQLSTINDKSESESRETESDARTADTPSETAAL